MQTTSMQSTNLIYGYVPHFHGQLRTLRYRKLYDQESIATRCLNTSATL